MKINNTTPSFGKTHINGANMNEKQNRMTNLLLNKINYCDEFHKADNNNVDLYIMPSGKKAINVYCVDTDSQQIIRDEKNKTKKHTFSTESSVRDFYKEINSLLSHLSQINDNKVERPQVKEFLIANAITDVAQMRPELYDNVREATDNYIQYYGLEANDAYNMAADDFIDEYKKTNINDDF